MQKVIVVLGSENAVNGELGVIAKDRLNKCLEIYTKDYLVACSGGWGPHFNTSTKPHAFYAMEYLKEKGILEKVILAPVFSGHTVDDAIKIKDFFKDSRIYELIIVTSDFHLERVTLIFNEILKGYNLRFISAISSLANDQLDRKIDHEKKSVQAIIENGLYY